jgi:hypothetical protein
LLRTIKVAILPFWAQLKLPRQRRVKVQCSFAIRVYLIPPHKHERSQWNWWRETNWGITRTWYHCSGHYNKWYVYCCHCRYNLLTWYGWNEEQQIHLKFPTLNRLSSASGGIFISQMEDVPGTPKMWKGDSTQLLQDQILESIIIVISREKLILLQVFKLEKINVRLSTIIHFYSYSLNSFTTHIYTLYVNKCWNV